MRNILLSMAFLLVLSSPPSFAESSPASPTSASQGNAFNDIDNFFVRTYSALCHENQTNSRPLLVVNGFSFNLLLEDGTVKTTAGKIRQFDELKGVSHLGACLYAIGASCWDKPNDDGWLTTIKDCKLKVDKAISEVDAIDWSCDAWPGGEEKLKNLIRTSLQKVSDFAQQRIETKSFTREDYSKFAKDYLPTMTTTFYLETLSGIHQTLRVLREWKSEVGDAKWGKMYFLIAGTQGRPTAGLTRETNPAGLILSTLLTPEQAATQIILAPGAATTEQAQQNLGNAITAGHLADALYGSSDPSEGSFYNALKHCEIPLALDNVKKVLKEFKQGMADERQGF